MRPAPACVTPSSSIVVVSAPSPWSAADRRLAALAGAPDAPVGRQALDHEGRGGEDEREFARPPADEAGQREDGCEQKDESEGRERRVMAQRQPAAQRSAQPDARGRGFGFRRRKGEGVRPERIGGSPRRHGSPGAFASSASAWRPSANSAGSSS